MMKKLGRMPAAIDTEGNGTFAGLGILPCELSPSKVLVPFSPQERQVLLQAGEQTFREVRCIEP